MNPYTSLIEQLANDLAYIKSGMGFDGMLVKQHLEGLLTFKQGSAARVKAEEALKLYKFDGKCCFPEESKPRLAELVSGILGNLQEIQK